jgi:hypothetical protein
VSEPLIIAERFNGIWFIEGIMWPIAAWPGPDGDENRKWYEPIEDER